MISGINESSQPISEIFFLLIQYFHKKLCDDIFSNAGKFRNISDPDEGKVHYGPYNPKIGRMAKFDGCHPENIYRELIELTSILSLEDTNSIFTAIKFYQRFVYIHPFYDTNGRIGRLLTKLYLGIHKYYIEWKPIEIDSKKKEQFINKLNKCHQQMDLPNYEYKLNKLYKFWQKYVISFDDLYSTDFHVQH